MNITYSGSVLKAIRVSAGKGQPLPKSLVYVIHNGKKYYCIADKNGRFEFRGLKPGMETTFNILPMPNFEQYSGIVWDDFWNNHVMNFIFNDRIL